MSAIQVAIRIKPPCTSSSGSSFNSYGSSSVKRSLKYPGSLDPDCEISTNDNIYPFPPWRVVGHDTLCYDGQTLPEGVRPSGPLSFTFGRLIFFVVDFESIL